MKIIIIILQAILNLVRKRRDLIANRNKIPPEYRDDVVVWYSPKKQKLTNYDVIESYVEDFTKWAYRTERGTATILNNKIIITDVILSSNIIEDSNQPYSDLTVYITGVTENKWLIVRQGRERPETHVKKDGLYTFKNNNLYFGFGVNQPGECNITITQLPTSILKDFSGNGHDAYMYGFQGKLNSGIGIYQTDFTAWGTISASGTMERSPNSLHITNVNNTGNAFIHTTEKVNAFKVKIEGNFNGLTFRYIYDNVNNGILFINSPGIYDFPAIENVNYNNGFYGSVFGGDCDITITQIPDYPNSLCYAGKQYCQAYNVPKFTDYTIITRRAILSINGSFGLISKRISPKQLGAFILEKDNNVAGAEPNTLRAFTFMTSTAVNPNLDYSITYQTKSEYNKQKLIIGNAGDSYVFLIGAGLYNETNNIVSEFITAVHDDIIIFKRSLTINEINDITKAIFNETIIEE